MSDGLTKLGEAARRARAAISPWQFFSPTDVAGFAPGGGIPSAVEPYKQGLQKTAEATKAFREGRYGDAAKWYGSGVLDTGAAALSALPEGGALTKMAMAFSPAVRKVYHYTDAATDFAAKDFRTPRGAVYTSLTPEGAQMGGQAAGMERAVDGRAPRIMPLISDAPVAGLDAPPAVKWPEKLTGSAVDELDAAIRGWNDPTLTPAQNEYARDVMWEVWDRGYKPGSGERVPDDVLERVLNPGVDYKSFEGSRAHLGANDLSGAEKAAALKALGYKGTRIIDDAPGSVAYFDPSDLRERYAQPEGAMSKLRGIKAFHGSPHDFDRFDMSKIGTGEGAQAYGHGLYFAENEGVAKSYRDALQHKAPVNVDGVDGGPRYILQNAIQDARKYPADQRAAKLQEWLDETEAMATGKFAPAGMSENVAEIKRLLASGEVTPDLADAGKMYEVRINADPEQFLDWDKPLSEQSEAVRRKFIDAHGQEEFDAIKDVPRGAEEWYRSLAEEGDPEAAAFLRDLQIPGIKYLDAGSRSAGDGSRNYVVFDDKLVEIVKKYGWAPGMAIPAAMALELQQAQEQSAPQM
jgi:hypothetical protein